MIRHGDLKVHPDWQPCREDEREYGWFLDGLFYRGCHCRALITAPGPHPLLRSSAQ